MRTLPERQDCRKAVLYAGRGDMLEMEEVVIVEVRKTPGQPSQLM